VSLKHDEINKNTQPAIENTALKITKTVF